MTGETFVPLLDANEQPVLGEAGEIVGSMQPCVGFGSNFKPMLVLAVTFGGLVMLYRILQPFNGLRFITYALSVGISILVLAVPVLGELVYTGWTDVELTFTQILYIVCIVLAAFPVSNLLVRGCDLMNPSE